MIINLTLQISRQRINKFLSIKYDYVYYLKIIVIFYIVVVFAASHAVISNPMHV